MKHLIPLLTFFFFSTAHAHKTEVYAGPHFNYMRMHFNNPSHLQGYGGGVTTGVEYRHWYFRGSLDFEGTWNAGPITGEPCQRSSIYDYFLEMKVGPTFLWGTWQFEPYTGFGWDRLNNEQDPKSASLCYRYDKLFIPVGFYLNWVFTNFTPGFQFEFRPDVYQNLKLLSVNLDPKWSYSFRTQLPLKQYFPFSWGRISLNFMPFFDWKRFGKVREKNSSGTLLKIPQLILWATGLRVLVGAEF